MVSANFINLVFLIFNIKIDNVIGRNKKKLKYESFLILKFFSISKFLSDNF